MSPERPPAKPRVIAPSVGMFLHCTRDRHGHEPRRRAPDELRYPASSLLCLMGPPGAGKSTLAARLLADVSTLAIDSVRTELIAQRDGEHVSFSEAIDELLARAETLLEGGESVCVEFVGTIAPLRWDIRRLAREHERPCHALMLDATERQCLAGQDKRGFRLSDEQNAEYRRRWEGLMIDLGIYCDPEDGEFDSIVVLDRAGASRLQAITFC